METNDRKEINKEDCFSLKKLKEEYEKIKGNHELPEFHELNKLFDIEDINSDTDFLIRRIRRVIADRIGAYSRFVEVMLNPSNAPVFFFNLLKKIDSNDREKITNIYETLGNLELEMVSLDLDYSEKKEAEFIKKVFKVFNNHVKEKFLEVIKKLENNDHVEKKDMNRSYFG